MIEKVEAFKVNKKIFATETEANKYVFEELSEVKIGDKVYVKDWWGNKSCTFGTVCCIEQEKIYFAIGNVPTEILGELKHGGKNIEHQGIVYSWEIGCHPRKNLIRV